MANIMQIVENEQTSEFYPTPPALVARMLEGIEWKYIQTVLEPSAGKGDILREIARKEYRLYEYRADGLDVDCIEIDANLRQILKYNFSGERKQATKSQIKEEKVYWSSVEQRTVKIELSEAEKAENAKLKAELETFLKKGIHIVHDDFLTYNPLKKYDLIIMNPPFSNGDKHLIKALKMQENGGNIICLLNAETIRNPYTESRKELVRQLEKHNAIIEYIDNAFVSAERRTGVEVALIKVTIEQVQEESDIYNRMKEAEQVEDFDPECTDLEVTDYIKAMVHRYNVECKAGIELIRQYRALQPYIMRTFDAEDKFNSPILRLTNKNDRSYDNCVPVNDYLQDVRLKYWRALLSNPKFTGKLTSKLQDEWSKKVQSLANYDFTEFNIYTISTEMNAQIKSGIEDEIIAMFDRLTEKHSYYPEFSKNRHYYNGWKTNSAYKIAKKVIIPCYGVFSEYSDRLDTYDARKVLEDIERILNFLDGGMTREVESWDKLADYFQQKISKNIPLKYFTATFYKKGTVHLTFTCPELIERFNIYAAQNKQWLPPTYGKKAYKDMDAEEKAVIDDFQGEAAYTEIMTKADYYLAPVTNNQMLRLG